VPCWPDVWEKFKNHLPMLGVYSSLLAYVAVVALLLWAPNVRKRWLLITSRVLGAAAVIPGVIALPAVPFGVLLISGDPAPQTRTIQSPDGQQALLIYQAGFLGRDHTEVRLKHTGCCRHEIVFWHAGPSGFDDPKIEWLDNRHLRIMYHTRPDDPQHCEQRVGDIAISCTSSPWPDSSATDQPQSGVPPKP
jgi:hypothetical protein